MKRLAHYGKHRHCASRTRPQRANSVAVETTRAEGDSSTLDAAPISHRQVSAGRQAAESVRQTAANTRQQATCAHPTRTAGAVHPAVCHPAAESAVTYSRASTDTIRIAGCCYVSPPITHQAPALDSTRPNMINGRGSLDINNAVLRRSSPVGRVLAGAALAKAVAQATLPINQLG